MDAPVYRCLTYHLFRLFTFRLLTFRLLTFHLCISRPPSRLSPPRGAGFRSGT